MQGPQPVDLRLLDRELRVHGGNCQLQPLLLEGVPRFVLVLLRLRLPELNRGDETQRGELLVRFRLQTRTDELRFGRGQRGALLQQAAFHLDPPIAVAGSPRVEIELRLERRLLELRVVQLDDDGLPG